MKIYKKIIHLIISFASALMGIYLISNAIYFTKDIYQLISGFLITIFSGIAVLNFCQTLIYYKKVGKK